MPMYEMTLQIANGEDRYFVVLADDIIDARRRMQSIIPWVGPEGTQVTGIVDGMEWDHGTALQFPDPSVGYFETDG